MTTKERPRKVALLSDRKSHFSQRSGPTSNSAAVYFTLAPRTSYIRPSYMIYKCPSRRIFCVLISDS